LKEGFLAGGNANGLGHSVLPLGRLWTVELAEYLKRRGGRVAARLKATRLHLEGDRVTAVDVEGEPAVRVDAVVLATPLRESWDLFPESLKSRHPLLEGAEASPILAVNFWFSRSPFDGPFVALLDMDLQWVFNREALWGPAGRGQVSAVLSAARSHEQRPSDELIALALADLRRAFPGFTEAPRHATVLWERRATPSPTPAFWSARPPVSTPVSNLVLAGDWTDVGPAAHDRGGLPQRSPGRGRAAAHGQTRPGGRPCLKPSSSIATASSPTRSTCIFPCSRKSWRRWASRSRKKSTSTTTSPWTTRAVTRAVFAAHNKPLTDEEMNRLIARKTDLYKKTAAQNLVILPGVVEFVMAVSQKFPLAMASGALRDEVKLMIGAAGIDSFFDVIVAAEDVVNGKPAPDAYLKALAGLNAKHPDRGIRPGECLVVEDSKHGLLSARAAGMKCVAVTTTYTAEELAAADKVVPVLTAVRVKDLEALFA
jgi:beta-phosphoglucomutase